MLTDPMQPHPYRIQRVRKETADTFTFDLAPVDDAIPPFIPGQFNILYARELEQWRDANRLTQLRA